MQSHPEKWGDRHDLVAESVTKGVTPADDVFGYLIESKQKQNLTRAPDRLHQITQAIPSRLQTRSDR